jgi:hypothetical protein
MFAYLSSKSLSLLSLLISFVCHCTLYRCDFFIFVILTVYCPVCLIFVSSSFYAVLPIGPLIFFLWFRFCPADTRFLFTFPCLIYLFLFLCLSVTSPSPCPFCQIHFFLSVLVSLSLYAMLSCFISWLCIYGTSFPPEVSQTFHLLVLLNIHVRPLFLISLLFRLAWTLLCGLHHRDNRRNFLGPLHLSLATLRAQLSGCEADHSPPPSAEDSNSWSYTPA